MWFIRLMLLVALVAVIGCNSGPAPEKVQAPPQIDQIKTALQGMAESGQAGSGVMQLETLVSELKAQDADKAAALQPGVDELKTLKDPKAVKAKAKEMLEKL